MNSICCRRAALTGVAFSTLALVLASAPSAQAQDQAAAVSEVEELVVTATPIRDSIAKSLEAQRVADNIVSVVAADAIGRFPDQTAAAALSRLPATGVQRDQGQERYIQVRGAPARWTNVAFDGVNVLGAEDRIFRFDSVPASVISQLELNKTLTPDMPGEALAGRVNILTFSPLSQQGFHVNADIGRGYVDLGDDVESYGGRVSWSNDTFGIVLGASKFSFIQETDASRSTASRGTPGPSTARSSGGLMSRTASAFPRFAASSWISKSATSTRSTLPAQPPARAPRHREASFPCRSRACSRMATTQPRIRFSFSTAIMSSPGGSSPGMWADRRLRSAKISHLQRHLRQQPATRRGPCCGHRSRLRRERPERP
jgi:hypothetical protein